MTKTELKIRIISTFKECLYAPKSDNPALFTIEFYLLLFHFNLFDALDKARLIKAIASLWRLNARGKPILGLHNRRPLSLDPNANLRKEQHDNGVAIAASSIFGLHENAGYLLDYGSRFCYTYNNVQPFTVDLRFLRQPFDIMVYKICAKRRLGVLGIIGLVHFYFKILLESLDKKENTSSRLLSWIRLSATEHKWYIKPINAFWNWYINNKYENGIEDLFLIYHKEASYLYQLSKGVRG